MPLPIKKLGFTNTLNAAAEWLAEALNDPGITPEHLIEQGRLQLLKLRAAIPTANISPPPDGEGYGLRLPYFDGLVDLNSMHCHLLQAQGAISIDKASDKGASYPLRKETIVTPDMLRVEKKELERYAAANIAEMSPPAQYVLNDSVQIPGKLPNTAIGKLAVRVAWEIECEKGRKATANEVISKLQEKVADKPAKSHVLLKSVPHGVVWVTSKNREKTYDIDACGKTLKAWWQSRQQGE